MLEATRHTRQGAFSVTTPEDRLSDAEKPNIVKAPARYSCCTLASWPPFMNTGGRDVHLMGRGNARKIRARSEPDPALQEQVQSIEPDWLDGVSFPGD